MTWKQHWPGNDGQRPMLTMFGRERQLHAAPREVGTVTRSSVIAGLDPAIRLLERFSRTGMDACAFAAPKRLRPRRRVKPAHDGGCVRYAPAAFLFCRFFTRSSTTAGSASVEV